REGGVGAGDRAAASPRGVREASLCRRDHRPRLPATGGFVRSILILVASMLLGPWAVAQDAYPSKALRIITPAAPGTSPDLLSRVIAQHLAPKLGQQVLVVNQPGGGGNIGHGNAARSAPDGYTLLVTSDQLAFNQTLFQNVSFHAPD